MILYHGTSRTAADDILANGIELSKSRQNIDFGRGFYMTQDKAAAISWARHNNWGGQTGNAAVLRFSLDDGLLNSLNIKRFATASEDWANIIYHERTCHGDLLRKYDFVIGPIADGRMTMLLAKLGQGL